MSTSNNKRTILIILIPVILIIIGIVAAAFLLLRATDTIKEEVNETMSVINHEGTDSTATDKDDADYATAVKAIKSGSSTAPSPASLSTTAKPKLAEFQDWFINGAMKNGAPDGVKKISDISEISGSWKAFLFLDPRNEHDNKAHAFETVTISGTNKKIEFKFKSYYIYFFNDNETINEEDFDPYTFNGRWYHGELCATGPGSFIITDFWEQDGKQYAIGTFNYPDGIVANMALMRP